MSFQYFCSREAEQFTFYRIPKILFIDRRFSKISIEAKVLYGLLLDRMSLSLKNQWIDDADRVYIYFKLEDVMELMGIGKDKGVKLFAELDAEKGCGLIQRKKQGLGKPTMIYVMNFTEHPKGGEAAGEPEESDVVQTSEKTKSAHEDIKTSVNPKSVLLKKRTPEVGKTDPNKTEVNDTKNIKTETASISPINDSEGEIAARRAYYRILSLNIDSDVLKEQYGGAMIDGILELMTDVICSKKTSISVGGEPMPTSVAKSRLLKLDSSHVEYVLDALQKNTSKIHNIRSYLLTALYHAYTTIEPYYTAEVQYHLNGGNER